MNIWSPLETKDARTGVVNYCLPCLISYTPHFENTQIVSELTNIYRQTVRESLKMEWLDQLSFKSANTCFF